MSFSKPSKRFVLLFFLLWLAGTLYGVAVFSLVSHTPIPLLHSFTQSKTSPLAHMVDALFPFFLLDAFLFFASYTVFIGSITVVCSILLGLLAGYGIGYLSMFFDSFTHLPYVIPIWIFIIVVHLLVICYFSYQCNIHSRLFCRYSYGRKKADFPRFFHFPYFCFSVGVQFILIIFYDLSLFILR